MATQISSLGEFALIDKLTTGFGAVNSSTVAGAGDDAAVIRCGDHYALLSTDLFAEGVDFDMVYTPLKHLGYKVIAASVSDICAMNGTPRQVLVALGVSSKYTVEMLEEFYSGVKAACEEYGVDLAGGDTNGSMTGLVVSVTCLGEVAGDDIVYRGGASKNDLVCVSGNLGAAFMGLHLLEREKHAFSGGGTPQPDFTGKEYILERQLRPRARRDIVEGLKERAIKPTSMIDISDGLGSEVLHICKRSGVGADIYLNRLPIATQTFAMADELKIDPVIAALNGGGDYELLFTVPLDKQAEIMAMPGVDVIGHITDAASGARLITPDGEPVMIQAQGWQPQDVSG